MRLNPYVHFDGQCKAAFDYYAKHLGGVVPMSMSYADMPGAEDKSDEARKRVVHTRLELTDATGTFMLMGSDFPPSMKGQPPIHGISLTLNVATPEEAERVFAALSDKGEIRMPMQETFFAHRHGMCVDQFGMPWMVNCEKTPT